MSWLSCASGVTDIFGLFPSPVTSVPAVGRDVVLNCGSAMMTSWPAAVPSVVGGEGSSVMRIPRSCAVSEDFAVACGSRKVAFEFDIGYVVSFGAQRIHGGRLQVPDLRCDPRCWIRFPALSLARNMGFLLGVRRDDSVPSPGTAPTAVSSRRPRGSVQLHLPASHCGEHSPSDCDGCVECHADCPPRSPNSCGSVVLRDDGDLRRPSDA